MGSVTAAEIATEQRFMTDLWNFRKSYYKGEVSEDWWAEFMDAAEDLSKKYNSDYLNQLILVCVDDIDRRYQAQAGRPWRSDPVKITYDRLVRNRGIERVSKN